MNTHDLDEAQDWIKGAVGANLVEIVPIHQPYLFHTERAPVSRAVGARDLTLAHVRTTTSRVTTIAQHPALLLAFAHDGAVLCGLGTGSGNGVAAYVPSAAHVSYVPPGADFLILLIGESFLIRCAQTRNFGESADDLAKFAAWSNREQLGPAVHRCWDGASRSEIDGADICARLETAFHQDVDAYLSGTSVAKRSPASALVSHCQDLLLAVRTRPVVASELAARTGASESRITQAFRDVVGRSVREWHQLQRLGQVRTALKQERPYSRTVAETARAFGFRHPGRFSELYVHEFGEYPSAALKQAS